MASAGKKVGGVVHTIGETADDPLRGGTGVGTNRRFRTVADIHGCHPTRAALVLPSVKIPTPRREKAVYPDGVAQVLDRGDHEQSGGLNATFSES
jgi:hypothetical protein